MLRFAQHDKVSAGVKTRTRERHSRGVGFIQIVLVLVVILVVTVIALKMYQRSGVPQVPGGGHPARAVLDRVELRVEGMESETDALVVTEELRKVPGVAGATVDYASRMASVTFDPARANRDQLIAAVGRAGFRAH